MKIHSCCVKRRLQNITGILTKLCADALQKNLLRNILNCMALYDTVSTTLNVLISNVISSFSTPFAGIATGVGLSIVDELFTRDLVEVFAYSWHFIFNSLFSWWYDG